MATVVVHHSVVTGAAADPNALVDGPAWDAAHTVTGVENVDNTSDANKPVSTAQAAADALVAANAANASNLSSGTVPAGRMPALTGDITTSAGAVATTLATVNSNVGTFGSATVTPVVTVNGKGLVTAVTTATITASPLAFTSSFGGRLTLTSGQPVMTTDVIGGQNLYYAPLTGKVVPVLTSGTWALQTFTSSSTDQVGLTLALAGSANWAADSIHDVFAVIDSGTLKLATRVWDAGMLPTETQITNVTTITTGTGATAWTRSTAAFDGNTAQADAAAARVSPSNSGQNNWIGQDWGVGVTKTISKVVITGPSDDNIRGDATAVLEIRVHGSSDNTNWHLIAVVNIACTGNGQVVTIPINVTEQNAYRYHRVGFNGNGVNAVNVAEIQFYNKVAPANGRRLTSHDGVLVNDASMTARTGASTTITTAQYEGTFLGVIHIDTATAGQVTAHFTYGASRTFGVWNAYNRRSIALNAGLYTTTTSYNPVSTQLWNSCESATSGSTFSLQVVSGLAEHCVTAELTRQVYLDCTANAAGYECGIGVDTTLNFSGYEGSCNIDTTGQAIGFNVRANLALSPFAGMKTLYAIEKQANSGTGTQSAFTGPRATQLIANWMG